MKILLLGDKCSLINDFLLSIGHDTYIYTDKLEVKDVKGYDFIISFGYRFIIKQEIIDLFTNKIINMHISLLPYNKGADPNLWSYLENSPKGVTIHQIDNGIDTGKIILQQEVQDNIETDTLKTSYDRLIQKIVKLFIDNAEGILNNKIKPYKQQGAGSLHYLKDKEKYIYLLEKKGYDTLVKDIINHINIRGGVARYVDNKQYLVVLKNYNISVILQNFIYCDNFLLNEILLWRNHIKTRLSSKNSAKIYKKEHYQFIDILRKDKTKLYFIVILDYINIGVISFTNINIESAYIGYYKNQFIERIGVGKILIETAVTYARDVLHLQELIMEAFVENTISQHCILKQNFKEINRKNGIIEYKLKLI